MLEGLNDRQIEAVTATEGFIRIIAGAGSGKTKALTHRYAYLVKAAGIHPGNVLCVTFTSKAAGEMKKRVRKLIGDGMDTSLITTYHGFCVRVLREDIGRLFYPDNFQILDNHAQKMILEEIYTELELKLDHADFEKIMDMINKVKSKTDYVKYMISRDEIPFGSDSTLDEKIIKMYLRRQKKIFGLDFNDLVNFVFVIFEQFQDVCRKWQERLHYIQVDEFQDSSERELKLINMLSEVNKNLFVVGDPDQNIYEWRGAKVGILVDFDQTHEATQTIIMNQNYRSTANILNAANTIIEKNQNRIKKDLFTVGESGEPVIHYHAKTESDECAWIVNMIRELKKSDYVYNEIAVLYRASFLSRNIEQAFMNEHIPYEIVGSTRFYDRMEIMDALAYLKLIAYDDDKALLRIINTPRRTFGKAKVTLLKTMAENDNMSLYQTLVLNRTRSEWARSDINNFIDLIESIREKYKTNSVSETVNEILQKSGYEQYIRESGNMERFENLCEFKKIALEMERGFGEHMTLGEFIRQISIMSDRDEEIETNTVKLMTIHAAKGLEYPVCFIVGMSDGIFPSGRTLEERKQLGLEEERRLCFVAITRAKQRLFFTDSEGVNQSGQKKTPSRFLFEIGENNCVHIGEIDKELLEESKNNTELTFNESETDYKIGDKIEHNIFGSGEIADIDDERGVYMIRFDKNGSVKPISKDYDFNTAKPEIPVSERIPEKKAPQYEQMSFLSEDIEPVKSPEPIEAVEEIEAIEAKQEKRNKPDLSDEANLWKDPTVPHAGWRCVDIIDLGEPDGICRMCGHQIIRYVHMMTHDNYPRRIGAGCICAGRMEGNEDAAKKRESEYKNRQMRLNTFLKRRRMKSKNGNEYIKYKNEVIVILPDKFNPGFFKTAYKNSFSGSHDTVEEALIEAFNLIDPPIKY